MPSLFPETDDDLPSQAARLAPQLRALAEEGIYFGTSSWKYPGWIGSIYSPERYLTNQKHSKAKFEATCLQEYAKTFPVVGGDFSFYKFYDDDYWKRFFDDIPASLLFAMKATETLTVARWTKQSNPKLAGQENPEFLDAKLFRKRFIDPLEPYAERLATIIFEFGTLPKAVFKAPGDFYAALDPFLADLPEGYLYSVEIRNAEYLTPQYFDLLSRRNVAHCFNAYTRMPGLDEQVQLEGAFTADFTACRALLKQGRGYSDAVDTFQPYNKIQEPNERARFGLAGIAKESKKRMKPAFLMINNRLEGNAPGTIEAVVQMLLPGME
jgi:uncharacterized protein YecE (DUF72 family)